MSKPTVAFTIISYDYIYDPDNKLSSEELAAKDAESRQKLKAFAESFENTVFKDHIDGFVFDELSGMWANFRRTQEAFSAVHSNRELWNKISYVSHSVSK